MLLLEFDLFTLLMKMASLRRGFPAIVVKKTIMLIVRFHLLIDQVTNFTMIS